MSDTPAPPPSSRAFPTPAAFEAWLSANHASSTELWLLIRKKASGLPTVTYAEALDVALCYGWIDGLKRSFDATSFLQRFTPRTPKSIWSLVNTAHVERLLAEGRMQPAGQRQIDLARADGRWANAYAAGRDMQTPDDLLQAVNANAEARKTFEILNRQNQFAMAFRLGNIKKPDVRARRIDDYVAMLARGETLVDNGKRYPTTLFSARKASVNPHVSATGKSP